MLVKYHAIRNRAYLRRYMRQQNRGSAIGFFVGSAITLARELLRLLAVEHTLTGITELLRGQVDALKILTDPTWHPMPPLD
jgi:hypothetical protein